VVEFAHHLTGFSFKVVPEKGVNNLYTTKFVKPFACTLKLHAIAGIFLTSCEG